MNITSVLHSKVPYVSAVCFRVLTSWQPPVLLLKFYLQEQINIFNLTGNIS
jgi:hypothetical protein